MFPRALFGQYASPRFSRCSFQKLSKSAIHANSRVFCRSSRLHAPKNTSSPARKRAPKPPAPSLPMKEPPAGARLAQFEKFLAGKNGSAVIFRAPSHRGYILGAYSVAAFCYAYAGFNFYTTSVDPRISVGKLEKGLFGGICLVMAVMGTVFLLRGSNLVSSVIAIQSHGKTRLDIKVRRMVPFLKPREFSIHPSQLSCSRQIVVPPRTPSQIEADAQKKAESETAVAQASFVKNPIQKTSVAMWKVFINCRRLFSQEDFVHLKIDGQKGTWRMDTTGHVSSGFLLLNNLIREGQLGGGLFNTNPTFGAHWPPGQPGLVGNARFGRDAPTGGLPHTAEDKNPQFRYGEPGWKVRPTDPGPDLASILLRQGEISYEELAVEEWLKKSLSMPQVPANRNLGVNNPLLVLSGSNRIIDVHVGSDKVPWRLHAKLLTLHSKFFSRALKDSSNEGGNTGQGKEGKKAGDKERSKMKVAMRDVDNNVFTLFVQWIYSQKFTTDSVPALLQAYLLGDKLQAFKFREEVLSRLYMLNIPLCLFTIEQVLWVVENTQSASKLRALVLDTVALAIVNKTVELKTEQWKLLEPVSVEILQAMDSILKSNTGTWIAKPPFYYNE